MSADTESLHIKISAFMDLEKWEDCISLLIESEENIVFDWQLFWDLGWCYYKLDKFDKSINSFKSSLSICPEKNKAICLGFLGISYLAMDNYIESENNLRQSLKINDSTITRQTLALCLMKQGKIEESEKIHIEGLKLNPNSTKRLEAYADFLSDIGRLDEASALYKTFE